MKRLLMVCHGNICRSTMAEYVMRDLVAKRGLADAIKIDSAATSRESLGCTPHRGTREVLKRHGIPCGSHRSRQMVRADYDSYDLICGMDQENLTGMYRIVAGERGYGYSWAPVSASYVAKADPAGKIHLLLDWSRDPREIADPWYTGDYNETYRDVREGCETLLDWLVAQGDL